MHTQSGSYGPCESCHKIHQLPTKEALPYAFALMKEFKVLMRLDFLTPALQADPRLAFAHLFAESRGSMFGVLLCENIQTQKKTVLRAFSSLRDDLRQIDGWVAPLLSAQVFNEVILPAQLQIKAMTTALSSIEKNEPAYVQLKAERKEISRLLWNTMLKSYKLQNFHGEQRSLTEAIYPKAPVPGGIGECCAPKLLNHAAKNNLRPLSLAEFYWSAPHAKGPKKRGQFYDSCEARCRPILGFMLCGHENAFDSP